VDAAGQARWEHFPHGADVGIRGAGPTLASALEQAALALTAVVTDPGRVEARESVEIACNDASSPDQLLYDWVDAIVYEMATRAMLFARFDVRVTGTRLSARLWGEPVDRARHEPAVEVKGPTYTQLRVAREGEDGPWVAQCIVDV
jgi:tRNA nucleotidyltransferase (CCA-adding enzyme)